MVNWMRIKKITKINYIQFAFRKFLWIFKCIYENLQSWIRQHERLLDINHFNWMARWNWLLGIYLLFLLLFSLIGWPINFSCFKWFNFLETTDTKVNSKHMTQSWQINVFLYQIDLPYIPQSKIKIFCECINKLNHFY